MKKVAIFGAGLYGRKAFLSLGEDAVECFIDNSPAKQGTTYCGKTVRSLEEIKEETGKLTILIASAYSQSMENQLREQGITDYAIFEDYQHGYYETDELIVNPYETVEESLTEEAWSESEKMEYARKAVYDIVETFRQNQPLFDHIEIETVNRCNGICSFCPVNRNVDPRTEAVMTRELFESIVDQLAELDYKGRFTTFSNNEPLLDERIIEFNQLARRKLPKARMHLFTNGTLLTLDKFAALAEILDELVIDNYQQDLKLIKPCAKIVEYCEGHPDLKKKVTIVLRKPEEILTTRGGTAPNRKRILEYGEDRCVLPFKQMIVRPDGKISLCCNDAIGQYTLGDLNREKLTDVWYGPKFQAVRRCLYEGRRKWGSCRYCDTFSMG